MEDYKKRFIVEYTQLNERQRKLCGMLNGYFDGKYNYTLDTPIELLIHQHSVMKEYLHILEQRAEYEDIDLSEFK